MRVSASQLVAFSVRPTPKSSGSLIVVSVRSARPSLRYCLTLRMLVVRLDLRLDAVVDDAGAEPAGGATGDLAGEHDLHVVGSPERELVAQHELEPVADVGGTLEHAGVGQLELADREPVVDSRGHGPQRSAARVGGAASTPRSARCRASTACRRYRPARRGHRPSETRYRAPQSRSHAWPPDAWPTRAR